MPGLLEYGSRIAKAALQQTKIKLGPWEGSMRSVSAEQVPLDYMAGGSNELYLPRSGTWKRRGGQTQKFDTFGAAVGHLPAKWNARCRDLQEFTSESITDGIPSLIALLTRETVTSGLDDGRFSNVWVRDQVGNLNYTIGSDFSGTTYPAPGTEQKYKFVPLWYDSGDGGITRGTSEFAARFFFGGSRRMLKVGNWWYFPSVLGTPSRWRGVPATATAAGRLMPSGPLPPTHAGTLTKGIQVESNATSVYPDADVTDGTWVGQDSGTSLFSYLDDGATVNDADYITSGNVAGDTCEVALGNFAFTPASDDTVTVRYRAMETLATAGNLTVHLMQGATIKASETQTTLIGAFVDCGFTLSPTQITSITDWNDLRLRFVLAAGGTGAVRVSWASLQHQSDAATTGGWRGSDKVYYTVAGRFEDDSIHMFCVPRGPTTTLPNGYNLFQVDAANPSASYDKITWSNIPILPYGYKSRILMRGTKIDTTTDSTLQLNPTDLRVVWEIQDNTTTTYDDYYADDDSLTMDVDQLLIRDDHIMPPRARYIFGGDSRACVSYGGLNPSAIIIAPVGRTADYDLNASDDTASLYNNDASFMRVVIDASGTNSLELAQTSGAAVTSTKTFDFATYDTLEKLVDAINATSCAVDGQQWRAQVCPGANPQAMCVNSLTPHLRALTALSVTSGSNELTRASGLSAIAVGATVIMTNVPTGTYVTRIDSDTKLIMSANATGNSTAGGQFVFTLGDTLTAGEAGRTGYQRVIAGSLPGFLYFNKTYLNLFPIQKSAVWMTVASPGAVKSAANCFSGKIANKHTPPLEAGISTGGAAVDNGFVVPFSNKNGAIRNTRDQGTGFDSDYHLFMLNESRGCCGWQSLTSGNRFAAFFSPEGWVACDLFNELLLSEAIYLHAPTAAGDFTYEAPLSIAATAADNDTSYISGHIIRGALWVNYRASGSHPNRQVKYDFSSGSISNGLRALLKGDKPWGWSKPLVRSVTALAEGRRSDGAHLYGWNDENAGSTGDGRVDEIETGDTDNGVAISASLTVPWIRMGSGQLSAQEVTVEHSTPAGATVLLDFVRSYQGDTYTLTPSTSSTLVVSRDVKMLTLPARSPTAACYLGWRQTAGGASELKSMEIRVKGPLGYK